MFKMSMCGVGLLLAGLLACSNQSGLNVTGGSTSGGQGISGTGGSSGGGLATGQSDCERAGGACEPESPGFCVGGWSPNTGGYSCRSSTNFCCFPLSYSPCETAGGTCTQVQPGSCPSGTIDDTSQYGCSNGGGPSICCMPSANGGASGTGGASGGAGSSGATGDLISNGGAISASGGSVSTGDLDTCSSDADCTTSCIWTTAPTDSSQCSAQYCCGSNWMSKRRCEANQAAWAIYCPNQSSTFIECPCAVMCDTPAQTITFGCVSGKCPLCQRE